MRHTYKEYKAANKILKEYREDWKEIRIHRKSQSEISIGTTLESELYYRKDKLNKLLYEFMDLNEENRKRYYIIYDRLVNVERRKIKLTRQLIHKKRKS